MKLKNKKTGEIIEFKIHKYAGKDSDGSEIYEVFEGDIEEWEDYEEPKKYWYITGEGDICRDDIKYSDWIEERKSIGNRFDTEEEAEKAVEKLKAITRLNDKGFKFEFGVLSAEIPSKDGVEYAHRFINIRAVMPTKEDALSSKKDLDLLFGGKE